MAHFVYILASNADGSIEIGTSDRPEPKSGKPRKLVWIEEHACKDDALLRQKRLGRWQRHWTDALIAQSNPEWRDLSSDAKA